MGIFDFIDGLFDDWTLGGFITWILVSLGVIYLTWFPLISSTIGLPTAHKWVISIIIPIGTWYFIHNKDWTANTFRGKKG